jgi:hypothetical protein
MAYFMEDPNKNWMIGGVLPWIGNTHLWKKLRNYCWGVDFKHLANGGFKQHM